MRAPRHRRPLLRQRYVPDGTDLEKVARCAAYIGSGEHKNGASFAGKSRPRADASICPEYLNWHQLTVTRWLRRAIRRGDVGGIWEGGFPRYAWHKDEHGNVYEARLTNSGKGEYKGYPLSRGEAPDFA